MAQGKSALAKLSVRATPAPSDLKNAIEIALEKIRFDPSQPRQAFHRADGQVARADQEALDELAQSIEANGLTSPITVEPVGDGQYRVVVGERRTRAHLQLGKKTILAVVRSDLGDRAQRLLFQLAENLGREDIPDVDMVDKIKDLMSPDGDRPAMTQSQIAKALGKSEGWVSRYVKFGHDEQQRLWVQTGIAVTVENVYRLSILPPPIQAEIQRRTSLPEDHEEFLAKPLERATIDAFKRKAAQQPRAPAPAPASEPPASAGSAGYEGVPQKAALELPPRDDAAATGHPEDDPVGAQFAAAAQDGRASSNEGTAGGERAKTSPAPAPAPAPSGYQLPEAARSQILQGAGVTLGSDGASAAQPPIGLRVALGRVLKLVSVLPPEQLEALGASLASASLPMPLALQIASTLEGRQVDAVEVATTLQNAVAQLQ